MTGLAPIPREPRMPRSSPMDDSSAADTALSTRRTALGSLAAVAAWSAAPQAFATPVLSTSVVNVPVTNGSTLDIDGSGSADFTLLFNNSQVIRITGLGGNVSAASNQFDGFNQSFYTKALTSGSTVDSSLSYAVTTTLAENGFSAAPSALGSFAAGIRFTGTDAQQHFGWVYFNFPTNTTPWAGSLAVSAGWETTPNTGIVAVPEPTTMALGAATVVACLAGRWLRTRGLRRRP
jgi:hypothetical protein